ncbi:branched-chain amino acid ABC transporter permease [Aurantimonas sp. 22II-16-19i]|uniref:branched-chain amino acid ABC transporter permease n=1 Tax=Aurantimonas sp. 22II-16-19i TaxID=1317114 RepID=UPI0009F7C40A|nr:branched-chain amino acid ABC transporter permease [Aurantimonas sp. 22II-16-19i]ORE87555.1 amino acid ABC transporter permease protein [Aurantimonas sp. 22II-16-19i]
MSALRPYLPVAALGVLLALAPLVVTSNVALNFLVFTLIIALAAQGWNLLGGFGGQFSFGHAAFFGVGAYVSAIWQMSLGLDAWTGFVAGTLAGAVTGLVIGFLAFRAGLRGSYFALVTLAFAEVFRVLANSSEATGGAAGLLLPLRIGAQNLQFADRSTFLAFVVALTILVLLLVQWIRGSRFGAQLVALRENEEAARALGVDVFAVKLKAIGLSGAITAAAGVLYLQYFLFIDSNIVFGTWISVEVLLAAIVGGLGTVLGPVVGALALHGLGEVVKHLAGDLPGIDLAVYGAVLVVAVAFLPGGLVGLFRRRPAPRQVRKAAPEGGRA